MLPVSCSYCNKKFLRRSGHVNENRKLGQQIYCSHKCLGLSKNRHKAVECDNPSCRKIFAKPQNQLSANNFCSRSCSVTFHNSLRTVHNQNFPKNYCRTCGKGIVSRQKYCSVECGVGSRRITKERIVKEITTLAQKLDRSPTTREYNRVDASYKQFGSWNNALLAAGLSPNRSLNQKMYKRRVCIAKDGHKCNSISELIIDNWLFAKNISHIKEAAYPEGKFTADWMVSSRILVEYFGLEKDSKRYDSTTEKKRKICKKFGLQLIEVHPTNLFPKNQLESLLSSLVG